MSETLQATCCVVGGGPAGMMLGLLLARAGVEVVVLEKHADFLRDFRGDTVHPSTLDVLSELGLLDEFLKRPHQEAKQLAGVVSGVTVPVADFTHLGTKCGFIGLMPQWDLLDMLAQRAGRYPTFRLLMQAEAIGLIEEGGRVGGVKARTPAGPLEVRVALVIGADGRRSTIRAQARLKVKDIGAPIDVLWMRLPRLPDDPGQSAGRFDRGQVLVMIDRGDYWQCAYVIPKGGFDEVKAQGIARFRTRLAEIAPFLQGRLDALKDWDDIKLLTVAVDRLPRWHRPGLLCIGDAAHAMSPIGGVGINLAIQDAVATANLLATPLRQGRVSESDLRAVQLRREWPAKVTQRVQVLIQDRIISRTLRGRKRIPLPWPLHLLKWFPLLRRLPAWLIGVGVRPEHVRTPEVAVPR